MITLLHTISQLGNGGRERRMVQLVKQLAAHGGYKQYILVFDKNIEYTDVYNTGAEIIFFDYSAKKAVAFRNLRDIIDRIRPDIVHSWNGGPIDVALSWFKFRYGFRYIAGYVADGIMLRRFSQSDIIHRISFACADAIVSNSRAGLVAKRAPMSKSHIIFNGFDYARFKSSKTKEDKRKELGITSKYLVAMLARMSPAKDYMSFINMAELAMKQHNDITFLCVGGGNDTILTEYRQIIAAKALTNIILLGNRQDIEEIIKACDITVLMSNPEVHAEGISNSIMESMAAGVPVIASDGGGTPEILEDGINGYIVTPHDSNAAYHKLCLLQTDDSLRSTFGANAVKTINRSFLLSTMGDRYIDLYNTLLQK